MYGLLDGVRMGFGEAVVSKHMVQEDDIIELVPYHNEVLSPVVLCYVKNRYLSSLQKKVIEHLRNDAPTFL